MASLHDDDEILSEMSYDESSNECSKTTHKKIKATIEYNPLKKFEKY